MPKYTIRVQINLEADDMEFDSEADAEEYGWAMVDMVNQYYVSVLSLLYYSYNHYSPDHNRGFLI